MNNAVNKNRRRTPVASLVLFVLTSLETDVLGLTLNP